MSEGIGGGMASLYDVFVDWEGRLGREMPGIQARLREVEAKRVLDVGCGTGRHVAALLDAGLDAHGADISEEMLTRARAFTNQSERFTQWRLGDPPPQSLGSFDAVLCMGNVWPQVAGDDDIARAGEALFALLRPGGLLLMGLKALAVRRESGNPYLPLLRREHEGHAIHFIRFADFSPPPPLCDFHMVVVGDAPECPLHNTHRVRAWGYDDLADALRAAGFADVRVSGRLDDPTAAPTTEDVFVHARA